MAATTHLLYLHGFRSSPLSSKAVRIGDWLQAHRPGVRFWCPQLPPSPQEALRLVVDGTAGWPADRSAVVGSSLGGFYATVVAEQLGWRAVLLNPAIDPARDLAPFVGVVPHYHRPDTSFEFTTADVEALRQRMPAAITRPERYAAVIAKGDEVLDWREMTGRYPGASIRLLDGGDHALSDFDSHLPFLLSFLEIEAQPT